MGISPHLSPPAPDAEELQAQFSKVWLETQNYVRQEMPIWREKYPGVEEMTLAVMGCVVNGPGESKHADVGISLPGTGESPAAPVFVDGKKSQNFTWG